jgi:hypothetical protein
MDSSVADGYKTNSCILGLAQRLPWPPVPTTAILCHHWLHELLNKVGQGKPAPAKIEFHKISAIQLAHVISPNN